MFYVGLDIHSKRISLCVLNETGQAVHRSPVRTIDQMMRVLEGLPDRFEVCYEAAGRDEKRRRGVHLHAGFADQRIDARS
jgi:hypothetical protein